MPSFFEEVDATGVVEHHIRQILGLEHSEAERILSSYEEVRLELANRLSRLPRDTFTAQHIRGVMAQVNGAILELNKSLGRNMTEGALKASKMGLDNLMTEIKTFDGQFLGAVTPINLNTALLAQDTSKHLVTKYDTNLKAYGTQLSTQISNGLFAAAIGQANYSEVVGRIGQFFTAEQWKLHRIVRTELHNIYNVGKIEGMRELVDDVPDLKKTLMHPQDARTGDDSTYAATLGLVAEINQPFSYEWKKKTRVFMAPPDRPNDRAIMVPYREAWGADRGDAFIKGRFPAA